MRSLKQSLDEHELIVLRVIGEWWELDLTGHDKPACIEALTIRLQELDLVEEKRYLPPEEVAALDDLIKHSGKKPVAAFARQHGEERLMGPGRLEREEPWFDPESATESLWYRGLLYRGFDQTADGMIEFYYLPDELYAQFTSVADEEDEAADSIGDDSLAESEYEDVEEPAYEDIDEPVYEDIDELEYEDIDESETEALYEPIDEEEATAVSPPSFNAPGTDEDDPDAIMPGATLPTPRKTPFLKERPSRIARPVQPPPTPSPNPPPKPADSTLQPTPPPARSAQISLTAVSPPPTILVAAVDAVDDLTALLTIAQQVGLDAAAGKKVAPFLLDPTPDRRSLLLNLALELEMLRETPNGLRPTRTAVSWLQQSREQQLQALADAWSSSQWNELRHTPGLICEGDWQNDPITARSDLLTLLPQTVGWYRVTDFVNYVKQENPDFQRPDGIYDTWYIRDEATNTFLSGFESWDKVEGRLIRTMLEGPMRWLGLVVLAHTIDGRLFMPTDRLIEWLNSVTPAADEVRVPLRVEPTGILSVPHTTDRYHRFQAARISEPLPVNAKRPFQYRLTPAALARAQQEGISADRILEFLQTASGQPLPPGVKRGINRWSERGVEGKVESVVVLRVREAGILETLRQNPRTRDYIGESLGDLAAAVRPGQWAALRDAVAQLGLLLDIEVG